MTQLNTEKNRKQGVFVLAMLAFVMAAFMPIGITIVGGPGAGALSGFLALYLCLYAGDSMFNYYSKGAKK